MGFMPIVRFIIRKPGGDPSAFLTEVRQKSLPLKQFRESNGILTGQIPARYYPTLARIARQNGLLIRHTEYRGGYWRLRRYRKRLGILAGMVLFFSVLLFSQCFLWAIDITPTDMVSEQQVLDVLKSHGLQIGTFLPTADLEKTAAYARTELPGLAFFALNRFGSRIQVAMTDAVSPPVHLRETDLCNIVARKDGIVRVVEDYAGQQVVQPGQSVGAGQLLISGIIENRDGNMLYVHADGKVLAETQETRTFTIPLTRTERIPTGETDTRWRIDLFGKKWPLFAALPSKNPYESTFSLTVPKIGPFYLPFALEKEEQQFYRENTITISEEEALELLRNMADAYREELSGQVEVLSQEESSASLSEDQVMQLTVTWKIMEDIAKEQPIGQS